MNYGIIESTQLFDKDVEMVDMLKGEEKNLLTNIGNSFSNITNCYNSTNTKSFTSKVDLLKGNINKIFNKRTTYVNLLKKIRIDYERLATETKTKFKSGG